MLAILRHAGIRTHYLNRERAIMQITRPFRLDIFSAAGRVAGRGASLQVYLGIALSTLIILFALLLAGVLDRLASQEVRRLTSQNLENISLQLARELAEGMNDFSREVQTQAQATRLRNPESDTATMRAVLDKFVAIHPDIAFIGVLDAETGTVLAANRGIFEGGSAKGRPVYEEGRKGLFLGDVHDAVRLAELLPKPASGDPLRFLDVAVPIADKEGKIYRVLAAHISFQWADNVRKAVLAPLRESRGIELFLIDTAGNVVLSPDDKVRVGTPLKSLLAGGPDASAQARVWSDGASYLSVAAPVVPRGSFPGFGWQVVARQPVAIAFGATRTLRNSFFAGALLLGATAAAVAWLIAGRITRPVTALAESASRLSTQPAGVAPIRSAIGEVTQMQQAINLLADERRRHANATGEQKRMFAAFSDSIPHLVFQADAHGALEYVNTQWRQLLGPVDGMRLEDLHGRMHEDDRAAYLALWRAGLLNGLTFDATVRLYPPDGAEARWFKLRAQAVHNADGAVFQWVGTLTDIHEAMLETERTEAALAKERQARVELEKVSRMKDEFLATLSHELRTPLNVIGGWAEMLQMRTQGDAYLHQAAVVIRRNVDLQAELINDLLDMSAVVAGKLVLEKKVQDGVPLLASACEFFTQLASAKGLAFDASLPALPVLVEADARRINQILSNLLSNAIKFTDSPGRITLDATERDGRLEIHIGDNGCGIEPEFLPFVFDRFRQQDPTSTRKRGGIGLGLAIVKSLVDLHGGDISVASAGSGKGCRFTLCLPALASQPPQLSPQTQHAFAWQDGNLDDRVRDKRILVIEDDASTREITCDILQGIGARVDAAASAADALAILAGKSFDLLICDIGMPDMDGYAFLRAVRSSGDPATASVPAIALTAFTLKHDQMAARKAGFQVHLAKPFTIASLAGAIDEATREATRESRTALA